MRRGAVGSTGDSGIAWHSRQQARDGQPIFQRHSTSRNPPPANLSAKNGTRGTKLDGFIRRPELCTRNAAPPADALRNCGIRSWAGRVVLDHEHSQYKLIAASLTATRRASREPTSSKHHTLLVDGARRSLGTGFSWGKTNVAFFDPKNVAIQVAVRVFPDEI